MMMYSFFDLWQSASWKFVVKSENTNQHSSENKSLKIPFAAHTEHTEPISHCWCLFDSYANFWCDDQTMRHGAFLAVRMYTQHMKSPVCASAPIGVDLITKTFLLWWWYFSMTALNFLSILYRAFGSVHRVCCSPNIFSTTHNNTDYRIFHAYEWISHAQK